MHHSFKDDFNKIIELEIMRSEKLRSTILSVIFLILAVLAFCVSFIPEVVDYFHKKLPFQLLALALIAVSIYEYGLRTVLKIFIKKNVRFPIFPRYLNALIETSIPTAGLLFLIPVFGPGPSLITPPVFAYFLYIGLSVLRVDFRLSLFTGFIAGMEYFLVALYYCMPGSSDILDFIQIHAAKSLLIFIAGCIAAFVTYQIRQRLINSFILREEKNQISEIFGQHVSPAVMDKLIKQDSDVLSEVRNVCIMFLDIRNFTNFSQNRKPEEVVDYLNSLFDFMIAIVIKNNGIINKFLGDGFMAVFGAPISDGNDQLNAVRASFEILDNLDRMNAGKKIIDTEIGIGLHSGKAVTGNLGSSTRREYTVIGDIVNLASRIEQQNKVFHSNLLVSSNVWNAVKGDFKNLESTDNFKYIGPVSVKGRDTEVELYKLR